MPAAVEPGLSDALTRLPDRNGCALWLLDTRRWQVDDAMLMLLLSAEERGRATAFHFDRDRRRYVMTHMAVRFLLAELTGIAPRDQQIAFTRNRQPRVLVPESTHVSISYAGVHVLIAISHEPVGVDAEPDLAVEDAAELADLHFTPLERAELSATAPAQRDHAFLRGWTRKEACVKLMGEGLFIPTDTFDCGIDDGCRRVTVGDMSIAVETIETDIPLVMAVARFSPER